MAKKTVGEQVCETVVKSIVGGVMAYGMHAVRTGIDSYMKEKAREKESAIVEQFDIDQKAYKALVRREQNMLWKCVKLERKLTREQRGTTEKEDLLLSKALGIVERVMKTPKAETPGRKIQETQISNSEQTLALIRKLNERIDSLERELGVRDAEDVSDEEAKADIFRAIKNDSERIEANNDILTLINEMADVREEEVYQNNVNVLGKKKADKIRDQYGMKVYLINKILKENGYIYREDVIKNGGI